MPTKRLSSSAFARHTSRAEFRAARNARAPVLCLLTACPRLAETPLVILTGDEGMPFLDLRYQARRRTPQELLDLPEVLPPRAQAHSRRLGILLPAEDGSMMLISTPSGIAAP